MVVEYSVLAVLAAIFSVEGAVFKDGDTFSAAVYEHAVVLPPSRSDVITRDEAVKHMDRNLDVMAERAKLAKDANILVFPEDGLYGFGFKSREAIYPYMEYVPEPSNQTLCPCDVTNSTYDISVQKRLSCIAKENEFYLVANMGDKQPCTRIVDTNCPLSGEYIFNTNVVFDPKGCLVAKYHKQHLFLTEPFNKPPVEHIFFDTPFGRFGTFICFDILFKEPAVTLVERHSIDHIVFPTAWMNVFPLFASIETHQAFARMMNVNLLSANIHLPLNRMVGSGIYTPQVHANFSYEPDDPEGQLVVATINRKPTPNRPYVPVEQKCARESFKVFRSVLFGDMYSWVKLEKPKDKLCVCQNRVCCFLDFSTNSLDNNDLYALGAFDGLHTLEGQYYIQACALVRCANQSEQSCGSSTTFANTTFNKIQLRGKFDTKYIMPEVLASPVGLDIGEWSFDDGQIATKDTMTKPLLSAMLLGRWYEKDKQSMSTPNSASGKNLHFFLIANLLIMFT